MRRPDLTPLHPVRPTSRPAPLPGANVVAVWSRPEDVLVDGLLEAVLRSAQPVPDGRVAPDAETLAARIDVAMMLAVADGRSEDDMLVAMAAHLPAFLQLLGEADFDEHCVRHAGLARLATVLEKRLLGRGSSRPDTGPAMRVAHAGPVGQGLG